MVAALINHIIQRELQTLRSMLLAYPDPPKIWHTPAGIPNSAGTLALHITGNLRYFIGAQIGGSHFVRNREAEFAGREIPREALLEQIDQTISEVDSVLSSLSEEILDREYPLAVGGVKLQTRDFLLHLSSHLSYHLGQLDYHRRFVTAIPDSVAALAIQSLKTAVKP